MKKNITILAAILLMVIMNAKAQTTIGLRVGATMSSVSNDEFYDLGDKKQFVQLGVFVPVDIAISDKFSIQPELSFVQKGARVVLKDSGFKMTGSFITNYIELPVLLKYKASIGNSKLYFGAGPSVGYWVSAKFKSVIEDPDGNKEKESETYEFISDGDVVDNRIEMVVYVAAGYQFPIGPGYLLADFRYGIDLNDYTKFKDKDLKPSDYTSTMNRNIIISLGYAIPIGGKNE